MAGSPLLPLCLVRVLVLGIFAPQEVGLSAAGQDVHVAADGDRLLVSGQGERGELRVPAMGTAPAGVLVRLRHHGREVQRRFAGAVLARARDGHVQLLNEVDEKHYVERVLDSEGQEAALVPAAAQALAVAVRSFAARAVQHPRHGDAALCDLTHCQVYRGEGPSAPWARAAAAATAGQVLGYRGAPTEAYFTARCGGATAASHEVWGGPARPHLQSRPCQPCQHDPGSVWTADIPLRELGAALQDQQLLPAGCALSGLAVAGRGAGGWASRVRASCESGPGPKSSEMSGEGLRLAVGRRLGWSRLPSARFTVRPGPSGLHFDGSGSGHGVGLCLYGAVQRGRAGWTLAQILESYFPGTTLLAHDCNRQ